MRAVHPPRHVAPDGTRARRLPPAAPDRRRRGRRRRRRAPLRAGVPRMPRGGRASTREPAASDHGFLLRRLGGMGDRRRRAVAGQQRGRTDGAARLAPRQRAIERDRLRGDGPGAPAHRPGHDHDEGGGTRGGRLAVRPGGRARAARPRGRARRSPPSRARSRRSARSGHPLAPTPTAPTAATAGDPILLSFFCAGTPSQQATDELLARLGVEPDEPSTTSGTAAADGPGGSRCAAPTATRR